MLDVNNVKSNNRQISVNCESKKSLAVHSIENGGAAWPWKDAEMPLSRWMTTPVSSSAFKHIKSKLSVLPS